MKYIPLSVRRRKRQELIGTVILIITLTPMALALILGAALAMAGCGDPFVTCQLPF